ncbi:MAG: hypothetical protein ACRYFX_04170 [Janthinobacterium lividum]
MPTSRRPLACNGEGDTRASCSNVQAGNSSARGSAPRQKQPRRKAYITWLPHLDCEVASCRATG